MNTTRAARRFFIFLLLALGAAIGCGDSEPDDAEEQRDDAGADPDAATADANAKPEKDAAASAPQVCEIEEGAETPDFVKRVGCQGDFDALASLPLDESIPGARSGKLVLDQLDNDELYFQNSNKYKIHYEFASAHLSGGDHPIVTSLVDFNNTEYYAPDRRFLLGALTYYESPDVWALEIATVDTMDVEMITRLFKAVQANVFVGKELKFHPTSEAIGNTAKELGDDVPVVTTDELYEGIDYQPLNLGETIGRVTFLSSTQLASTYVNPRDIVVLDSVPNDISVVAALITEEFQTPLAHVNVLAQNRKTPNMGLRNAQTNTKIEAVEGKWAKLTVGAFEWDIVEVTQAEADAWWEEHKPKPVTLPAADLTVKDLRDISEVTEHVDGERVTLEAIKKAVTAFGAKAANYSVLTHIPEVPIKPGFAIPAFYYVQFMETNGFFDQVEALLADDAFLDDPAVRDQKLGELRDAIKAAPIDPDLDMLLREKLASGYPPDRTIRFRTSTNAEDLDGFPCAGCYDSHTGDPADWEGDMLHAIRQTWATVWNFRTFEERQYHSIDHTTVAMSLLVHSNFPDEEANGVAITANPFDPSGLSPGYYVNVQFGGDVEVVAPPPGVTSDSFIYSSNAQGSSINYLTHSSLIAEGTTVLSDRQVHDLGLALEAIHEEFKDAYGPQPGSNAWYAMDCEFKFDDEDMPGTTPVLYIKQARPYAGRGK